MAVSTPVPLLTWCLSNGEEHELFLKYCENMSYLASSLPVIPLTPSKEAMQIFTTGSNSERSKLAKPELLDGELFDDSL